jgi:hypothetical protein
MIRELNTRQDTFVTVSLLWDDETGETLIELSTDSSEEIFPVPNDCAARAFDHPFVYAAGIPDRKKLAVQRR